MKNLRFVFLLLVTSSSPSWLGVDGDRDGAASRVSLTCGDGEDTCSIIIGANLTLTIVQDLNQSVTYDFMYKVGDDILTEPKKNGKLMFSPLHLQSLNGNETRKLLIETSLGNNSAGEIRIALNTSELSLDLDKTVIDVKITRSSWLDVFSTVVGWIYFLAWSISFYPQCYINFKRKSVIGLNFDFLSLNLTGFTCYAIFNLCLYYNHVVQEQFYKANPLTVIQVAPNDVVFALHAIALTIITIVQCFIYERGQQTVSKVCRGILTLCFLFVLVSLILAGANVINWLNFVYYLSYVKLGITLIKYIPQAFMNYKYGLSDSPKCSRPFVPPKAHMLYYNLAYFRRKSTEGWSIGNILLDFTGGSLSLLQMFLTSYNYDDWNSIFGNVTKFSLGLFSVLFDVFFMLQHYVFYRNARPYDEIINGASKQVGPF